MAPNLNKDFVCIVDRESQELAAVISSYLCKPGEYLPMFEFGAVRCYKSEYPGPQSIHFPSHTTAEEFNVRIYNALQHLSKHVTIVVAGLDGPQYSYLEVLENRNVIYINTIAEVDSALGPYTKKDDAILTTKEDIHIGLFNAIMSNSVLEIADETKYKPFDDYNLSGAVVIEQSEYTSSVIAANYGISVNAQVLVIKKPEIEREEILSLVERRHNEKKESYLLDLGAQVYQCIEGIDFSQFEYATFFTYGVPYSLILKNEIPVTHVNVNLNPDFFIFNCVLKELRTTTHTAIVFSPRAFGKNEETDFVVKKLSCSNYYVRTLIDNDATVHNIEKAVSEFPYELLHFCSHGGTVGGYAVESEFYDQDGVRHVIEYDEVVSIAPEPGKKLIPVTSKYIWRKLDGYIWKSQELKDQNYPDHVYEAFWNRIGEINEISRRPKDDIVGSCHVKCKYFVYQAMIHTVAGNRENPFVFSNTCWSWWNVSDDFLSLGVSGYLGTLWAVDNQVARDFAEVFYEQIPGGRALDAIQESMKITKGTGDENNYAYWGLHFSTITNSESYQLNRINTLRILKQSVDFWTSRIDRANSQSTRELISSKMNWLKREVIKMFYELPVK